MTSACNERSHSKLKLIKTETRSTSSDERTEALLVVAVEKQICSSLSLSSLVDTFALKPRKRKYVIIVTRMTYVSETEFGIDGTLRCHFFH